jgi:protein-tyrosine phosphatase
MIDLHSHLIPGVDDGAADLDEARAALLRLRESGVHTAVTTPHFNASATENPDRMAAALERIDRGWEQLQALARDEFSDLRVERGVEMMLDSPRPVLEDPRVRLAGTKFVLVEFNFQGVPPGAPRVLYEMKMAGFHPVVAHPERYQHGGDPFAGPEEWRRVGALLQVNWGSLAGRYGRGPQEVAWGLLERGWADFASSDHHARGRLGARSAAELIVGRGGEEQLQLLSETNPARLLDGQAPLPVPPLPPGVSFLRRLLGRR